MTPREYQTLVERWIKFNYPEEKDKPKPVKEYEKISAEETLKQFQAITQQIKK